MRNFLLPAFVVIHLLSPYCWGLDASPINTSLAPDKRDEALVVLDDVPTKQDTNPVNVVISDLVDGIYWLNLKIPVASTYRFQGYFAPGFPWVSRGVNVAGNTFESDIWVPKAGSMAKTTGLTQKRFTISHDGYYPVTYQVPKSLQDGDNLLLRAHLYGWGGASNYCETFGDNRGYISVRNCASEYPDNDTTNGMSFWAFYGGYPDAANVSNENGERVAESLLSVEARHATSIDQGAGFTLAGNSYGGSGSILLSMTIPKIQHRISVVDALIPITLFIKNRYPKSDPVQRAWNGIDTDVADFRLVGPSGKVDHIFYRIHGGSNDKNNNDTEFYRICNEHKIACLGTWHAGGHGIKEAGVSVPAELYPGDSNMQARLDNVLPVFTNSTANSPLNADRGHYNLGLSWNTKGIVNSTERLLIPLKYLAFKGLTSDATKPFPDMPDKISASVTVRRSPTFAITPGSRLRWKFGWQGGVARAHATKAEVTIDGLRFRSSTAVYKDLVLTKFEKKS